MWLFVIVAIAIVLAVIANKQQEDYHVEPKKTPNLDRLAKEGLKSKSFSQPYNPLNYLPAIEYNKINICTIKSRKQYRDFVVIDFETTGLSYAYDKIIEVAAIRIVDLKMKDTYTTLVNPEIRIPAAAIKVHGITDEMVSSAPTIDKVIPKLLDFIGDNIIVAHNAPFDVEFLYANAYLLHMEKCFSAVDTLYLSRKLFPNLENHKLGTVAEHMNIHMSCAHRSLDDAIATAQILIAGIEILNNRDEERKKERERLKNQSS